MFAWKPDPMSRTEISQKMPALVTCVTRIFISQLRKAEQHLILNFCFRSLRHVEKRFGGIVTLDSQTDLSGCTALDNDTEACAILSAITCKENLCSETSGNYWGSGGGTTGRFFFEIPSPNKSAWTDRIKGT